MFYFVIFCSHYKNLLYDLSRYTYMLFLQYLFLGVMLVVLEVGSSSFYFIASQNKHDLVREYDQTSLKGHSK